MIRYSIALLLFVLVAVVPMSVFAADDQGDATNPPADASVTLINPLGPGGSSLETFLNSILDIVIRIGSIVVVVMLVYVGFLFVAAQGNSTKLEAARKALLWTVIGALILLGAKALAVGIKATVQALSAGT
jgi:heme/copper-type cytochrome/quinol oxidase subunit 2